MQQFRHDSHPWEHLLVNGALHVVNHGETADGLQKVVLRPGGRATESEVVQHVHAAETDTKPQRQPAQVPNGTAAPSHSHPAAQTAQAMQGGSVGGRTPLEKYLLVVQQQHDGVELLAGAVVGAQRDDEVVEAVARCLCRNDDQLVLEPVGFGILKAVVFAALCGVGQPSTQWARPGGGSAPGSPRSPCTPCPASGSRTGLSRAAGGTGSGSSRCRASLGGSPSRTCSREKSE